MMNFAMVTNVEPIQFKYAPQATIKDYKAITLANVRYCYLTLLLLPLLLLAFAAGMSRRDCAIQYPIPRWMKFQILSR